MAEPYVIFIYRLMSSLETLFPDLDGFEWDAGNSDKNWLRREARQAEAEQALLNTPLVVSVTAKHSGPEPRHVALGRTEAGRFLTVVFTVRGTRVRVISARAMSRAERVVYGQIETDAQDRS